MNYYTITEEDKFNEFEESFKKCFKEICELEAEGITDKKINWFVDDSGKCYCQVWGLNCAYSNSDLESNREKYLDEDPICHFILIIGRWEDEVRAELIREMRETK
jgi:hypothetical protein